MNFKSTENLLKSQDRQLIRTQTFDISSSSSTHSNRGRKVVVENVQVHQPEPVPRNKNAFSAAQRGKTAKDNANEMIQMSTFSTSVDEEIEEFISPTPIPVKEVSKPTHGVELEDFSDISSVSSRRNGKKYKKSPDKPEIDEGSFVVHKSGIWGDNIPTVATVEQKLSEHEKENDESLKEKKSSSLKVVNEKPVKSQKSEMRPRTSKPKQKLSKKIKSESNQTLYRSSVATNTSSESESKEEIPSSKHQKKDRSKDSSDTSYSTSVASNSKASSEEILKDEDNISSNSNQILGVYVHHTTDLKFDIRIRDPRVRVTIVDERTGGLAIYDQQTIKKKQMEQPFILPMTTKQCDFISQIAIRCKWEELLLFNENLSHPDFKHVMLFFEILDYHNIGNDDPDGFYEIAWAFLKPFRDDVPFHFNKRLVLQLFYYQKLTKRQKLNEHVPVFNQWSLKHKKYPAVLETTVKEITPVSPSHNLHLAEDAEKISDRFSKDLEHLKDTLLGKAFQVPKKIIFKKRLTRKGSLVTAFSGSGHYLAYTDVVDSSQHNILILSVPDFAICHVLRGHSALIHDLEWIDSTYLLSASADQSCILWSVENGIGALLKVMPHSSFVYASRCLLVERHSLVVVTGGRDGLIRVWKCHEKRNSADIYQEMEGHDDYVTCLVCTKQKTLLTADASGVIIEWKYEHKSLRKERNIDVEKFRGQVITDMLLHTTECKVFCQIEGTSEIFVLGLPSGVLIQKLDLKERPGSVHQRLSLSSCGSYLFCPNGYHLVVYNLLNDQIESELRIPYVHGGKSFISGSSVALRHQTLAISVYGEGGGLVIYGSESPVTDMSSMDLNGLIKSKNFEMQERTEVGAHLKEMIQKIDDVFLGGNKSQAKSMPELREMSENEDETQSTDESLEEEEEEQSNEKSSGTFTINPAPQKVVQIHDPNRTFSISDNKKAPIPAKRKNKAVLRDQTFSIDDEQQDDDTTISESFH